MTASILKRTLLLCLLIGLQACDSQSSNDINPTYAQGEIVEIYDTYGIFFFYVPDEIETLTDIVVIIHGTPVKNKSAEETALSYIERWVSFADEHGVVLIAPSFNEENFSSKHGELEDKMTGYRGLFGREIGANEWVLRIVKAYRPLFSDAGNKISLYGHSAGGQFVSRFVMVHPDAVNKAVITSAATYPQPKEDIEWPFGMGELQAEIEWDENTLVQENVIPEKKKWLEATQIPLTVIIGLNDTAEQPERPGQKGKTRKTIGRNWVQDMKEFAEENEMVCEWEVELIPGVGHGDSGLVSYAQQAMIRMEK